MLRYEEYGVRRLVAALIYGDLSSYLWLKRRQVAAFHIKNGLVNVFFPIQIVFNTELNAVCASF